MIRCRSLSVVALFFLALAPGFGRLEKSPGVFSLNVATAIWQPGPWVIIEDAHGAFADLAVDSVTHRLLAAHRDDGTADFIDLDKNRLVARVEVGRTVSIACDPKSGCYFASVPDDERIAIIDGTTLKETGSIALPGAGGAVLFDAQQGELLVSNPAGGRLWIVDPVAGKVTATILLPASAAAMAGDPDGGRLFLTLPASNEIAVVDTRSRAVVFRWATGPVIRPRCLAFDRVHDQLFVTGENHQLIALNATSGAIIARCALGGNPGQIAFDPGTQCLSCAAPDWIFPVECSAGVLLPRAPLDSGTTATNVAVDPLTHAVWTTLTDGEDSYAKSWSAINPIPLKR